MKNTGTISDNIYVSLYSSGSVGLRLAIEALVESGYSRIELGGGPFYDRNYRASLLKLGKLHGLKFIVHNYFPIPQAPFSFNFASASSETRLLSRRLAERALELCNVVESDRYSIHAGFRLSPPPHELGAGFSESALISRELAWRIFEDEFELLHKLAEKYGVRLFVENNVLGAKNSKKFKENPFLFTDSSEVDRVRRMGAEVLLDVAHLKVSCNNLGLDFSVEFNALAAGCRYFHVSNNSGVEDENAGIAPDDQIAKLIQPADHRRQDVIFTLEVYDGLPSLRSSYEVLEALCRIGSSAVSPC